MTTKFNLSDICKRAWFSARCIARDTGATVKSCLSEGFKRAWRLAKFDAQPKAPVLRREDCATRAQLSYIASLGGKADCNTSKRDASALIDQLLAAKRSRRSSASYDYEQYDSGEVARMRRYRHAIVD